MRAMREFPPLLDLAAAFRPQPLHLRRLDQLVPRAREEQDGEVGRQLGDRFVRGPDLVQEEGDERREEGQNPRDELRLRGLGGYVSSVCLA